MVAAEFNLSASTLNSLYESGDKYNTNQIVRNFWKYGVQKGVSESPTFFINGAPLIAAPGNVDGWISLLDDVYAAQFHKTEVTGAIQNSIITITSALSLYALI